MCARTRSSGIVRSLDGVRSRISPSMSSAAQHVSWSLVAKSNKASPMVW